MKTTRCCALFSDGKQCRANAVNFYLYHGDPEIYEWDGRTPTWVLAPLCDLHKPQKSGPHAKRMKGTKK